MTQFLEIINLLSNPTAILPNSEQQKVSIWFLIFSTHFKNRKKLKLKNF